MKLSLVIAILYILCIGVVSFVPSYTMMWFLYSGYIGLISLTVLVTVCKFGYGTSLDSVGGQIGTIAITFATCLGLLSLLVLVNLGFEFRSFLFSWGRVVAVCFSVGINTLAVMIGPLFNERFLRFDYDEDAPFPLE